MTFEGFVDQIPEDVKSHIKEVVESPTWSECWHTGWHVKLRNGYTISVQYGPGVHADHFDWLLEQVQAGKIDSLMTAWQEAYDFSDSTTAEVAIWDEHHNYDRYGNVLEGMCPENHLNVTEVIEIIRLFGARGSK